MEGRVSGLLQLKGMSVIVGENHKYAKVQIDFSIICLPVSKLRDLNDFIIQLNPSFCTFLSMTMEVSIEVCHLCVCFCGFLSLSSYFLQLLVTSISTSSRILLSKNLANAFSHNVLKSKRKHWYKIIFCKIDQSKKHSFSLCGKEKVGFLFS